MNKQNAYIIELMYKKHFNNLINAIFCLLGNYHDAEDVVESVYMDIMRHKLTKEISYEEILLLCKRKLHSGEKIKNAQATIICADPLEILLEKENENRIIECIDSIKRTYRTVMRLYYLQGMRPCEIADKLYIKQNTATKKVLRGKRVLQNFLIKKGYK